MKLKTILIIAAAITTIVSAILYAASEYSPIRLHNLSSSILEKQDMESRQDINNNGTPKFTTATYELAQYPVFSNVDGAEVINDLILDKVKSMILSYEDLSGSIEYSVLECNSEMISVEFYGDFVFLPSKKPLMLHSCISIDMKNKKQIKLNDIVKIDEDFIRKYSESLRLKFREKYPDTDHNPFELDQNVIYNTEYLEYYLNKADELVYNNELDAYLDPNIKSCIHENNIILSMDLPQALGFYIEVEMPLEDVNF